MRILGIDFGEKRIGLALSDPLGFTAQGIETIPHEGIGFLLERLLRISKEHGVGEAVIGLPVNMNGSVGPKAKEVLEFASQLEKTLGVPVSTWDERLTSRQVERLMDEEGFSSAKKRKRTDRLAAVLILQSYLDSQRNRGKS
ncbi:MAG: Holliday junction resolvase RuvX [Candidatus Omnitrophica bacterium]|nr:Holliday junction resolvase RuvX [Candidatus Omnitrophota bacterium]